MNKGDLLSDLKQQAIDDPNLPLKDTATNMVFGEGNPDTDVYFLGEAPGRFEDLQGRPFVGPAGKLLDKLLTDINLKRADVFITSVLWFRPPKNRDPKPTEIDAFVPYIDKQIEIIKPKVIATLGRYSMHKFLPRTKISENHGQIFDIEHNGLKIKLIPLYHPAAALRRVDVMQTLKKDFLKLGELLGKI